MEWRDEPTHYDEYYWYRGPGWERPTVVFVKSHPGPREWMPVHVEPFAEVSNGITMQGRWFGPIAPPPESN